MSKLSEEYKEKLHNLGKPIEELINDLPVRTLLKIGKRVCSTDYAVRFYYNKQHPKFHLNKKALQHAVRRAWAVGAFNHKKQILDILGDDVYVKYPVVEEPERHTKLNIIKSKPRKVVSGAGKNANHRISHQ